MKKVEMALSPLMKESELLAKITDGDQHAFRIIYDRFYVSIYSYALHLLKSDLLAEENVQETFLALWNYGTKLNEIKNLESFLITISKNRSLNVLKRSKLEVRAGRESIEDLYTNLGHNETEEWIMLNDTRKIVDEAIAALPPQQKLVYQLCRQDGLKYEDVAKELNLSTNTVKLYMKLALGSLRGYVSRHTDIAILLILFKLL